MNDDAVEGPSTDLMIFPPALFFPTPLTRNMTNLVVLKSLSSVNFAYKVKTTAPSRYVVKPRAGIIPAHKTVHVSITFSARDQAAVAAILAGKDRDKFMLEVRPVDDKLADQFAQHPEMDLWAKGMFDEGRVTRQKLKCHFADVAPEGVAVQMIDDPRANGLLVYPEALGTADQARAVAATLVSTAMTNSTTSQSGSEQGSSSAMMMPSSPTRESSSTSSASSANPNSNSNQTGGGSSFLSPVAPPPASQSDRDAESTSSSTTTTTTSSTPIVTTTNSNSSSTNSAAPASSPTPSSASGSGSTAAPAPIMTPSSTTTNGSTSASTNNTIADDAASLKAQLELIREELRLSREDATRQGQSLDTMRRANEAQVREIQRLKDQLARAEESARKAVLASATSGSAAEKAGGKNGSSSSQQQQQQQAANMLAGLVDAQMMPYLVLAIAIVFFLLGRIL